ncbi:MAG: hypothetical protein REV35_01210 [Burkholderia sp.]|nr:hypothetical protein [Burkholderia sp.]
MKPFILTGDITYIDKILDKPLDVHVYFTGMIDNLLVDIVAS